MTATLQHPASAPVVELDVRDDLRSGREPFSRIIAAVDGLRDHDVLHLRAIFEPVPLFKALGKRGFVHESQHHGPEDWSVWFWRDAGQERPAAARGAGETRPSRAPAAPQPSPAIRGDNVIELDVRGLMPPEPMMRTLTALETLPAGHTLVQVNERVPQFLLPVLAERGFSCEIDESVPGVVRLRIWHSLSTPGHEPTTMSASLIELDVRVIPPRDKHPTIFNTFDSLAVGTSMVIVNDHDPKPLRYQLAAERPDSFTWTYEAEGPQVWRVRIDRR
jgi:uncharacterized protein (DUF2249 family)